MEEREKKEGLWVISRTAVAIIFGAWCHLSYSTNFRKSSQAPLYQTLFSFYTWILFDIVLILISIKHRQIIDQAIDKAIKISKKA